MNYAAFRRHFGFKRSWASSLLIVVFYFTAASWSWSIQQLQPHHRRPPLSASSSSTAPSLSIRNTKPSQQREQATFVLQFHKSSHTTIPSGGGNTITTTSSSSSSLLFSEHQTSDDWVAIIDESELIQSIIQAKTTREVDQTLRRALRNETTATTLQSTSTLDNDVDDTAGLLEDSFQGHHHIQQHDSNKLPLSQLSLNVSATLLRRMAHVSVNEKKRSLDHKQLQSAATTTTNANNDMELLRESMLVELLQTIGSQLVEASRHRRRYQYPEDENDSSNSNNNAMLDVVALSDILQALAVFASTSSSTTRDKLLPMANLVADLLNRVETATLYSSLKPIRLVQCLQAMDKLGIIRRRQQSSFQPALNQKIVERLLKPDAIGGLPARFLAHGLSTFASIQKHSAEAAATTTTAAAADDKEDTSIKMLSKSFMRRLRKKQVLEEATAEDLTRALVATSDLLQSGAMKGMEDEMAIFGFTSLRRALDLHSLSKRDNSGRILLTTKQVVDLISSWSIVTDRSREDTVIEQLMEVCVEDGILKDCTLNQLASIIKAVQKLDINNRASFASALGERFLTVIKEYDGADSLEEINPKLACNILRWPILSHRREKDVQKPFIDASLILLENPSFLSECSIADTSNFLWFLSSTRTFDEDVVINIGSSLLEQKVIEGSCAKMASRILATFSSLISLPRNTPSQELLQIQQDLFQSYGGHLLTSVLTPAEISSSLHAYAKASYIHDMGIFDHLVGLLASSRRLCTCRQLSQSLWSCGKMAAWEDVDTQPNAPVAMEHSSVPYLVDAKLVAEELACRVEDLTPTDIAQTVWALGRLEIGDHDIMEAFLRQATDHHVEFSSGQVTNILWGMAQTGQKDTVTINALSLRLTNEVIHLSPVEASSALFSLGRLDWCDEAVFASLSNTMMERIESANAQSVANALWAYKTVGLPAPQKLLNTWAIEKLGLQNFKIFDD